MSVEDAVTLAEEVANATEEMFDDWYSHVEEIIELIIRNDVDHGYTRSFISFQTLEDTYLFDKVLKINPFLIPEHLVDQYFDLLQKNVPTLKRMTPKEDIVMFEFSWQEEVETKEKKRKLEEQTPK